METQMTKPRLLETLRTKRAEWDAAVSEVPPNRLTEPGVAGHWSVKDIVSHLTYYERWMADRIHEQLRGENFIPTEIDMIPSIDARNNRIYEQTKDLPLETVLADSRQTFQRLIEGVEAHTEAFLTEPQQFEGAPEPIIVWKMLRSEVYNHYALHIPSIKAWLGIPYEVPVDTVHPLVRQQRFTRGEFVRALHGVTDEEARKRFGSMNCLSWMVAHLASQEQRYWLTAAQNKVLIPEVNELAGFGKPASTPPLDEMWAAWQAITAATDPWLDTLTSEKLTTHLVRPDGETLPESIGSMLRRVTYHYWFHLGESQAVRQLLGHTNLGIFVGAIHDEAPYVPE